MTGTIMRDDQHMVRCPDALIRARKAIRRFLNNSECGTLQIIAIEPSLERDLKYAITHEGWGLELSVARKSISEAQLNAWKSNDEHDTFSGITTLQLFSLVKVTKPH